MNENYELFELIRVLTRTEKRYFKLRTAGLKKNKIYILLFDAIDKSVSGNETCFRSNNKGKPFMKNYSYNKFYLYNLIIKTLAEYRAETSVDGRLHNMIMRCKILFDKALYRQYFKSLTAAKKFALRHERYGYLLQVLEMEKVIIKKEELQSIKNELLYNEGIAAINHAKNSFEFSKISGKLLSTYRAHGLKRSEEYEKLSEELLNNNIMYTDTKDFSPKECEAFYRIHEIINDIKGNFDISRQMQLKRLKLIKEHPDTFKDLIIDYELDVVSSLIYTSLKLNALQDAKNYLTLFAKLTPGDNQSGDYEILEALINFLIRLKKGDFQKAQRLVPVLEKILIKYNNKMLIDTELIIRYNLIKYHVMIKDFEKSLNLANALLMHPLLNKRADLECYLKILNLVIHFELKNYELLKYLIISTYRFLAKKKKLFRMETLVMEFLRMLSQIKKNEELKFAFLRLKNKLKQLKNDPYEKNALEYFDFLQWVEEKIKTIK